ncbi:HAD-IA family hydrolase [soil metagenome]
MSLAEKVRRAIGQKEHVVWDWNGTLLADVDHAIAVGNELMAGQGLRLMDRERFRAEFEFPILTYYQKLGFNFELESFESLCHRFVARFMEGVRDLPLVPEMESVLFSLKAEGLHQSVLSASDQESLDFMIDHFGLRDVFGLVYGIDDKFAASKIARGHSLMAVSPAAKEKTVLIGDTLHDLEVARALGIDAILISHGHQCVTRLRAHHDVVIEAALSDA